jgi:D-amino-acid dehydrogenase
MSQHVCVLGGGVIGTATAYYLARNGHRVTVLDGGEGVGMGTSFANGGQLAYSFVAPLAAPGVLRHLPGWMMSREAPLHFVPGLSMKQWRWCALFLLACTAARSRQSTVEMLGLGEYSRELVGELLRDEPLDFDFHHSGKLSVYRDAGEFDAARRGIEFFARFGVAQSALDAAGCVALEPALAPMAGTIAGGVLTESADTGDCFRFTAGLARVSASRYGARFVHGARVRSLRREGARIVAAATSAGEIEADAFVVALGNESVPLLKALGVDLPVHPLIGYSLTVPVRDTHHAPRVSVTDAHHKFVYARLGDRLRIAGMVDLTSGRTAGDARRIALMKRLAIETLPNAGDYDAAVAWTGYRPTTPDGKPVLGASPYRNLWLNTGHGPLGFTFACASAKLVADALAGESTRVEMDAFGIGRRWF